MDRKANPFSFWFSASPPYWWGEFSSDCGCSGWVMSVTAPVLRAACLELIQAWGCEYGEGMVKVNDHRTGIKEGLQWRCWLPKWCMWTRPQEMSSDSLVATALLLCSDGCQGLEMAVGLLGKKWRGSSSLSWWVVQVCGVKLGYS